MSVEEYKALAESLYRGAMEDMDWKNRKYLVDLMFDGADEDGRN
jgi:hypothetical protein